MGSAEPVATGQGHPSGAQSERCPSGQSPADRIAPPARGRLGVVDLTCLGLNGVIGSGIIATPGDIAATLGGLAPAAFAAGGLLCLVIALCFAEMAAMLPATGGAYVYARAAFGAGPGFLVGWTMWVAAVLGWATVAALLADMLVPPDSPWLSLRPAVAAALVLGLSGVNALGARPGALLNNALTGLKILGLGAFLAWTLPRLDAQAFLPAAPGWGVDPIVGFLLILYTFSGFEEVPVPAGEARHPQRTVPFSLVLVLLVSTLLYVLIQGAVGALAPAGSKWPLADAVASSPGLVALVGLTSLALVGGVNASIAFTGPRSLWALARDGEMPEWLAGIHPRLGTPLRCIGVTAAVVLALVLTGSFRSLAVLSVLAALLQYIPTLAALLVLRYREPERPRPFRLPHGEALAAVGLGVCLFLLSQASWRDLGWTAVGLALGGAIYLLRPRRASGS